MVCFAVADDFGVSLQEMHAIEERMLELYRPTYRERAQLLADITDFYRSIVCWGQYKLLCEWLAAEETFTHTFLRVIVNYQL